MPSLCNKHRLRTEIDSEPTPYKPQAEIHIHIVDEEVLVKAAYILEHSKLDQTSRGDRLALVQGHSSSYPRVAGNEQLRILVEGIGSNNSHIFDTLPVECQVSVDELIDHARSGLAVVIERQDPSKSLAARPFNSLIIGPRKPLISVVEDSG